MHVKTYYFFRTIFIIVLPLMEVTEDLQLSVTSIEGLVIELRMSVVKSRVTFMCVFVFMWKIK